MKEVKTKVNKKRVKGERAKIETNKPTKNK